MRKSELFSLIKPHRKTILFILACILAVNLFALLLPWVIKVIIDDVLVNKNIRLLNVIMAALTGLLILRSLFSFLRSYLSNLLGDRIVQDLQQKIHDHIGCLSIKSIDRISSSQIVSRITSDVEQVRRFLFGDAIEFIYSFLNIGFIIAILFFLNVKLTVAALLTLPLFAVLYCRWVPELKNRYKRLRELSGYLSLRFSEVLNGIRMVRAFDRDVYEKELFAEKQQNILRVASRTHYLNSWLWMGIEFFTSFGVIGILWIGGSDVIANRMSTGQLVAFYTYLGLLFAPIIRIVIIHTSYQQASASMQRIEDIFEIADDVPRAEHPVPVTSLEGRIEFKDVHFHYNFGQRILQDISFVVEPGQTVGIVGASGSGKTTLISLLLRFFDPAQGEIQVDGLDLRSLDLRSYRQRISVVLQDDFIFSGTIAENIGYGNLKASSDEIVEAARVAQAHQFISALPKGYQTEIGERGFNLSSGQRQRISIARAIVKDPSILILDEATSAVDALTENEIQKSIRRRMKGRTTFIVAHRFSTIMEADQIIVLENGRIVESGDHNYLLKKRGFYSSLYFEQFKERDEISFAAMQGL